MIANRHMYEYGTTAQQMAKVAVDQRRSSFKNPLATFNDRELIIDDDQFADDCRPASSFRNRQSVQRRIGGGRGVAEIARRTKHPAGPAARRGRILQSREHHLCAVADRLARESRGRDGVHAGDHLVKECSGDARRIAGIIELSDLDVLVGGDDWALEGYAAGAVGWVTGVGNVAPAECLALQEHVLAGRLAQARELYPRLQPLARLDMTPHLVQYFKGRWMLSAGTVAPAHAARLPLDADQRAVLDTALSALGVTAAA